MPELPEVETIRQDLRRRILSKKIVQVDVLRKKVVQIGRAENLIGDNFKEIERRGKLIILVLRSGRYMLVHLKMTGQLIYQDESCLVAGGHSMRVDGNSEKEFVKLPNKYTAVIFSFADKSRLFFNDMRQFGYIKIVSKEEKKKIESKYGIEPLDTKFTQKYFYELLKKSGGNIKTFLLKQEKIAGIGNIYADEVCFQACVRPDRKVGDLKRQEIVKIYQSIKSILKLAVKHRGTTFSDYLDSDGKKGNFVKYLKVYGREGEKCYRCGGVMRKIRVAGRGTVFCLWCQK